MGDRTNVVSHAHNTASKLSGIELIGAITEHESNQGDCSGSAKKKNSEDFLEQCLMETSSKNLVETLKFTNDLKMSIPSSMQDTMMKLVHKL